MAYSLYVYLKPEVLKARIPYWDDYFEKNPWLKIPPKGEENLFAHVKPRIENGNDRFVAFMDGVQAAQELDLVVDLIGDRWSNPTPDHIKELMYQLGYLTLIDQIRFNE